MFIDIHSHQQTGNKKNIEIFNLYDDFDGVNDENYYSLGLHPYYLDELSWKQEMVSLESNVVRNAVAAVGECGLDKVCKTDFTLQQEVFAAHIVLANKIKKPLVIHCVKSFEEVDKMLNLYNNKVPVIFHGFNRNEVIARQLVSKGFFLSFGKSILYTSKGEILKVVRLENLFLETDDGSVSIEEIYDAAATLLQIKSLELQSQIEKNATTIFGDSFIKL